MLSSVHGSGCKHSPNSSSRIPNFLAFAYALPLKSSNYFLEVISGCSATVLRISSSDQCLTLIGLPNNSSSNFNFRALS